MNPLIARYRQLLNPIKSTLSSIQQLPQQLGAVSQAIPAPKVNSATYNVLQGLAKVQPLAERALPKTSILGAVARGGNVNRASQESMTKFYNNYLDPNNTQAMINLITTFGPGAIAENGAKFSNAVMSKSPPQINYNINRMDGGGLDSILAYYKQFPKSLDLDAVKASYKGSPKALKAIAEAQEEVARTAIKTSHLAQKEAAIGVKFNTAKTVGDIRRAEQEMAELRTQGGSFIGGLSKSANQSGGTVSKLAKSLPKQMPQLGDKGSLVDETLPPMVTGGALSVKQKVTPLDYIRTPDRVLNKIGLGEQAKSIRAGYDAYLDELPKEIDKITQWSKRVTPEGNNRIFKHLDGQKVDLLPEEQKVATEVKDYLSKWADRLNLPQEKRISNYITHIFEKGMIEKEFDPDLAKIIDERVPGSVYDPFTEQRLGKMGYVEDTWRALDAYVKRATRKVNMDPSLESTAQVANQLEQSQYDYVKAYLDKVNMRPDKLDNLFDNWIKSVAGYRFGQRPVAALSKGARQMVYRGTLGLNIGSAVRNLTQGANTYAKLGEKYTVIGYMKALKAIAGGSDELENVLKQDIIEDRSISATRKFWEKTDKGLFFFFEQAEKINRGAAYFGAKSKALSKGLDEAQAIEYAKKIVRDTQFTFGRVDTPVALQNDVVKLLTQFQSYNIKQTEFLAEMVKNKEYVGVIRWLGASMFMISSIGKLIGMEPKDIIPSFRIGNSPLFELGKDALGAATGAPDQYGNEQDLGDRLRTFGDDLVPLVPGGVQIKKTVGGLVDTGRGYAGTTQGNVKFPVGQDPVTRVRAGLFGTNRLPEAQEYYKNKTRPLSEKQSEVYRSAPDKQGAYKEILDKRALDNQEEALRNEVKDTGEIRQSQNKVFYMSPEGEVKSVPLNRELYKPKLSGNQELDKLEVAKQLASFTQRINDVRDLYSLGVIQASEAERIIKTLKGEQERIKVKTKKPKKLKAIKLKIKKPKKIKMAKVKKPKTYKLKAVKLKRVKRLA